MKVSKLSRSLFWVALAVLAVTPTVGLAVEHHMGDRNDPWNNCTTCHGTDLLGGMGPSCMSCHIDFSPPDAPATGHHMGDRNAPLENCGLCHGSTLEGAMGPSCFTCHDDVWASSGGGGNQPPVVDPGGPYSGTPGVAINFDASGTTDADGDSLIYLWLFGDGSLPGLPSSNPIPAPHAYENAGTYTGTLTVTDGTNSPVLVNFTVEIAVSVNQAPTADAGGPYAAITEGDSVTVNGSGSSDPDGDSLTYNWNFGDGATGSGVSASHTYTTPGTYTITLSVDDGTAAPDTDTAQITVEEEVIIVDPPGGGGGDFQSGKWEILVPFFMGELTIEVEPFGPILLMHITHPDGSESFGIGMEFAGNIFWMDVTGALYYGALDPATGDAWGMVFGYEGNGGSSIWFGEKQ